MTALTLPSLPAVPLPAKPEPLLPRFPSLLVLEPFDAAQALLDWLDKVNGSALSADTLLLSLQAARNSANRTQQRLGSLACELGTEDPTAMTRLLAQGLQLETALHQSYKRLAILRDKESSGWLASAKPRIEAVAAALDSAWQLQLYFTRHHSQLPAGFWLDCHQLYQHVTTQGWAQKRGAESDTSLAARYAAILLTGLLASNGLQSSALDAFAELLRTDAHHLKLVEAEARLPDDGAFVFSSAADASPRFITDWPTRRSAGPWWQLELAPLLEVVQQRLQDLPEPVSQVQLQLLLQLRQSWSHPARRRHRRRRRLEGDHLQLHVSLDKCWAALANADGLPQHKASELQVVDLSLSGIQLQGEGRLHTMQPGEVVLLGRKQNNWRCGIVRRINSFGMSSWYGVEYIGKQLQAVRIRADNSLNGDHWQQALLMKGSLRSGYRSLILIEGRPFRILRPFILQLETGEVAIQSSRLLMQNLHYQLFEYKTL
ncbi:hypothetical protein [Craterilacuibacter sp.]|uniref:hypothetical protein n=1 Tax=Craterilacuibacter sp. TaxID=2870909 RepID=UPI003F2EDFE6